MPVEETLNAAKTLSSEIGCAVSRALWFLKDDKLELAEEETRRLCARVSVGAACSYAQESLLLLEKVHGQLMRSVPEEKSE